MQLANICPEQWVSQQQGFTDFLMMMVKLAAAWIEWASDYRVQSNYFEFNLAILLSLCFVKYEAYRFLF